MSWGAKRMKRKKIKTRETISALEEACEGNE
jgi:hypothetical protein